MNPAHEIAPFFPSTTEPGLLRFAADTLRQLRTFSARNEISSEARSALPAISALLACERYVAFALSRPFPWNSGLTCVGKCKGMARISSPGKRRKRARRVHASSLQRHSRNADGSFPHRPPRHLDLQLLFRPLDVQAWLRSLPVRRQAHRRHHHHSRRRRLLIH